MSLSPDMVGEMPMLVSSKLTAIFVATFLIGAAAGGLVAWDLTDTKASDFIKRTSNADSLAARMDQRYLTDFQLTPEEVARISPLTKEFATRLVSIRHQFGVDVIATMEEYHTRIAEQMTPAHRELYAKANEDRKKRMTSMLLPEEAGPANGP